MWSQITNVYANRVQIDTRTSIRRSMIAVLEIAGPLAHPSSSLFWVALGVRVHLKALDTPYQHGSTLLHTQEFLA